ncbi:MAG: DUF3160 domain-containing protein, partial [Candidatus Thorarchaeota archaeon]
MITSSLGATVLINGHSVLERGTKYRCAHLLYMHPSNLRRAIDGPTKRKMASGGIIASLLAVSMVVTIGVFVVPYNPYTPNGNTVFTINQTVSNSFADYIPYDVEFTPNAPSYSIAPGLSNVANLDQFPDLTAEEITLLEQNGFVARPQNDFDQIYEILEANKDNGYPNFITTDSVLHAFHILYDLALREAE